MDEDLRREILDLPTRHRSTTILVLLAAKCSGNATPKLRATPEVIPALDCSLGTGRAELVTS